MKTRKIVTGIVVAALAGTMAVAAVGCAQSGTSSASSTPSSSASSASSNSSDSLASDIASNVSNTATNMAENAADNAVGVIGGVSDAADGVKSGATATKITASDLAKVDETIEFGDFEGMEKLSKDIQNGFATGKVVKIRGLVSNFGKGMSYNIVQEKDNNKVGTTFVIEGASEDAYPIDGTQISLVGIVVAEPNGLVYTIHTLPEFIEISA